MAVEDIAAWYELPAGTVVTLRLQSEPGARIAESAIGLDPTLTWIVYVPGQAPADLHTNIVEALSHDGGPRLRSGEAVPAERMNAAAWAAAVALGYVSEDV